VRYRRRTDGEIIAAQAAMVRDMVNSPSADRPTVIAAIARGLARKHRLKSRAGTDRMRKLAWARSWRGVGSVQRQFIIAEYAAAGRSLRRPCRKAITFDSGGISIKPSTTWTMRTI